ncbi:MAG: class I SAM-dependent methyltransferase [Phycisphaera sp.]|nr:MAG: class I SAM-dependent methyltransferase [Phycisphaera sp.]
MTTDYAAIYDHQIENNPAYSRAEYSPGFAAIHQHADRISTLKGRALDVGCGVGFVVEQLSRPPFNLDAFGIDISSSAIEVATQRVPSDHLAICNGCSIEHPDEVFDLVTCFDVLEHLDESDIPKFTAELQRIIRPGGTLMCSVALRTASAVDQFGENVHRTVKPLDWWLDAIQPDDAHWIRIPAQAILWKQY